MIKKISLTNFKSWGSISLKISPLTGLFGTNSSGKTSIIQSILLLKQTVESTDRSQVINLGEKNSYVDLGTFEEVIHTHDTNSELIFNIEFTTDTLIVIEDPYNKGKELFRGSIINFLSVIKESNSNKLYIDKLSYNYSDFNFVMERTGRSDRYEYKLNAYSANGESSDSFKFIRTTGRQWGLPQPLKFYGFPDQVSAYFQNTSFLLRLQLALEEQLNKVYYLGPLREDPKRQYIWGGTSSPGDVGRRGEQVIHAILASKSKGERISRGRGKPKFTVEQYVAYWLQELGLIQSFRVEEIAEGSSLYRVYVRRNENSSEVLIPDVGFGVSQILPVIALCYYVPEGSTVLLEQPEIHLHPKVQSGLADLFIDAIRVKKIQIIVESHSEHFMKRLQRRIAEESFSNDETSLYFCNYGENGSSISELDIDEFGAIKNWPKDFFGDEFMETSATAKAVISRKLKNQ